MSAEFSYPPSLLPNVPRDREADAQISRRRKAAHIVWMGTLAVPQFLLDIVRDDANISGRKRDDHGGPAFPFVFLTGGLIFGIIDAYQFPRREVDRYRMWKQDQTTRKEKPITRKERRSLLSF